MDANAKADWEQLQKKPEVYFKCGHEHCGKVDAMEYEEFKKHLTDIHAIVIDKTTQGNKQMTMHMDGDYWYSSNYTWTLSNGFVFYQSFRGARAATDPMFISNSPMHERRKK